MNDERAAVVEFAGRESSSAGGASSHGVSEHFSVTQCEEGGAREICHPLSAINVKKANEQSSVAQSNALALNQYLDD